MWKSITTEYYPVPNDKDYRRVDREYEGSFSEGLTFLALSLTIEHLQKNVRQMYIHDLDGERSDSVVSIYSVYGIGPTGQIAFKPFQFHDHALDWVCTTESQKADLQLKAMSFKEDNGDAIKKLLELARPA